jgi:hypothetical protein
MVKERRQGVLLATPLTLMVLATPMALGQADQSTMAQQLLAGNLRDRAAALRAAAAVRPRGGRLRVASGSRHIARKENRIVEDALRRGEALANVEDPEFVALLSGVVAGLGDPRAIGALSKATYGGVTTSRALAAFGQQAARSVLSIVTSPESHWGERT